MVKVHRTGGGGEPPAVDYQVSNASCEGAAAVSSPWTGLCDLAIGHIFTIHQQAVCTGRQQMGNEAVGAAVAMTSMSCNCTQDSTSNE